MLVEILYQLVRARFTVEMLYELMLGFRGGLVNGVPGTSIYKCPF